MQRTDVAESHEILKEKLAKEFKDKVRERKREKERERGLLSEFQRFRFS